MPDTQIRCQNQISPSVIAITLASLGEEAATLDTIRKFIFSFVFRAATRLRFNLKEK
jgi:hypothetical protein